jgi:hypothetical protein
LSGIGTDYYSNPRHPEGSGGGGRSTAGPAYFDDLVSDVAVIPAKKSRDLRY